MADLSYQEFLRGKQVRALPQGVDAGKLPKKLFAFQRETVQWALRQGRAALFFDCGLGKTPMQLAWARRISEATKLPVLVLAPLAVSHQTRREGEKFGIGVTIARDGTDVDGPGVYVANYERLGKLDSVDFGGVVLDESSILKSYMGKTKQRLLERFADTPYRLCCTATPAPNDHLELGNHCEFLGVMSSHEMLARWFLPDTSTFGTYTLKGHAVSPFWDWVASWARCAERPGDLGHDDAGFALPPLDVRRVLVDVDVTEERGEKLFRSADMSATGIHNERRRTSAARAAAVARAVAEEPEEQWLIWTDTDYDAESLRNAIPDLTEVKGGDSEQVKEERLLGFADGGVRRLLTKPKLAGFGMNWQNCARVAFVGVSYSYEQFYQAIRRTWRFGQARAVVAHVVVATTEAHVWDVVSKKALGHESMKREMRAAMLRAQARAEQRRASYQPSEPIRLPEWVQEERCNSVT